MRELLLKEVDDTTQKKLKEKIQKYIREQKNSETIIFLEKRLKLSQKKLKETKSKRNYYFEKNKNREISKQQFEQIMIDYEYEGYKCELEVLLTKKELVSKQYFIKRLQYILLLLDSLNNESLLAVFFKHIEEEREEQFKLDQKILQLYLLYNSGTNYIVDRSDKFYLEKEEKEQLMDNLVLIRVKMRDLKLNVLELDNIDFESVSINDLISSNIEFVNEQLMKKQKKR